MPKTKKSFEKSSSEVDFILTEMGKIDTEYPYPDNAVIANIGVPNFGKTVTVFQCPIGTLAEYQNSDPSIGPATPHLNQGITDLLNGKKNELTVGARKHGNLSVFKVTIS